MPEVVQADANTLLNDLKQERKNIKSRFTRFSNFLKDPRNKENVTQIQMRLNNIQTSLSEFEKVQSKIDVLMKVAERGTETQEFEDLYFQEIATAQEMLRISQPPSITSRSNQTSQATNTSQSNIASNEALNVRLPKLDLPTFNGAYHGWLNFYDSFKVKIHENKQLRDIQKLHYLRSCLKDEAMKVIESLETSSANYSIAWDLLKERFDNSRIIIQSHIETLMELPSFNKESASNIRSLLDNVQMHMRALKALDEPVDQWSSLLIYIITSKVDRYTHREWEKSINGTKMPQLDTLLEFLRNRYQILEASHFENNNHSYQKNKKSQALSSTQQINFCNFCRGEHRIYSCEKFLKLSVEERVDAVKKAGLCINCFRKGHFTKDCTLSKCKQCSKKHN